MSRRLVRILGSAVVASVAVVGSPGALPAADAAGGAVVVRGLALPSTARMATLGCASLNSGASAPSLMIDRNPAGGGTGSRSLAVTPGGGGATGPQYSLSNLVGTSTAAVSVHAPQGTSGVAYAVYQERTDRNSQHVWVGRAALQVPASSGWQVVDARDQAFRWAKIDLRTGATVVPGAAAALPLGTFAGASGGAGGYLTVGFGCDGRPFALDALQVGGTTYDLEGVPSSTSVAASADEVDAGTPVTLTGSVTAGGRPVPDATAIVEEQVDGGEWRQATRDGVPLVAGPGLSIQVVPEETTRYRYRFADRPGVEASTSAPVTVTVRGDREKPTRQKKTPKPSPESSPSAPQSTAPAPATSSAPMQPAPSAEPSAEPEQAPAAPSPEAPEPPASEPPAQKPSPKPSPSPSPSETPSPSEKPAQKPAPRPSPTPTPTPTPSGAADQPARETETAPAR